MDFTKMQGLGNDFIVINHIPQNINFTPDLIRKMADRHCGIGCDQVLLLEPSNRADIDFFYKIYNADGSESGQCGNGARCLGKFIEAQGLSNKKTLLLQTNARILALDLLENSLVRVNMGVPENIEKKIVSSYTGLSVWMGNPHIVFREDNLNNPYLNNLNLNHINIGFMKILSRNCLQLRVFERGAGETLACGSGACAAAVAGIVQNFLKSDQQITVELALGKLYIDWRGESFPVFMTGPAEIVFEGKINL